MSWIETNPMWSKRGFVSYIYQPLLLLHCLHLYVHINNHSDSMILVFAMLDDSILSARPHLYFYSTINGIWQDCWLTRTFFCRGGDDKVFKRCKIQAFDIIWTQFRGWLAPCWTELGWVRCKFSAARISASTPSPIGRDPLCIATLLKILSRLNIAWLFLRSSTNCTLLAKTVTVT